MAGDVVSAFNGLCQAGDALVARTAAHITNMCTHLMRSLERCLGHGFNVRVKEVTQTTVQTVDRGLVDEPIPTAKLRKSSCARSRTICEGAKVCGVQAESVKHDSRSRHHSLAYQRIHGGIDHTPDLPRTHSVAQRGRYGEHAPRLAQIASTRALDFTNAERCGVPYDNQVCGSGTMRLFSHLIDNKTL